MGGYKLTTPLKPEGDQPKAIQGLVQGITHGVKHQTLLGVTGSGKTFTMACAIAELNRPALVISHNKTLAAQLCQEFRSFFPENAIEYFVSYYDYYQPEAYVPQTDTYIEKDSAINEEIDRLRHSATSALLERRDVIIVASVSCIYGLGTPEDYMSAMIDIKSGMSVSREDLIRQLVSVKYQRNDVELVRGRFRVRGDIIEVCPAYEKNTFRIELDGDRVDRIVELAPTTGEIVRRTERVAIYPATHFVTFRDRLDSAIASITEELEARLKSFKDSGKFLEAQRLEQRTRYDMEMIKEMGYCQGIENYSRHMDGRAAGEPPATLLNYFPDDFIMFIDESHVTLPQVRGMYEGDHSRKQTLVDFGFRLPSALDNRPLKFPEFQKYMHQVVYVSATPGQDELKQSKRVVEQIIRPTGLVDPEVVVRGTKGQIDDLMKEIKERTKRKERVLITTLTKRMAEDLSEYLEEHGIRVRYLHSDIETLDRIDILRGLRLGEFDVLVGINLLREGLDLPEVSLVAILDADKEGFLRGETSLIQTIGRAARNVNGRVILYAEKITRSMHKAISETNRRRSIQVAYNKKHRIIPKTIIKEIHDIRDQLRAAEVKDVKKLKDFLPIEEAPALIQALEEEMRTAAIALEFEKAAALRDRIKEIKVAFGIR